jgi:electron transfer flavoprotein beta subunit
MIWVTLITLLWMIRGTANRKPAAENASSRRVEALKIIVCMKIVIDPEAPASLFRVDTEAKKVIPPKGTPPVLNPFDENALEAALRLKDSAGASITVLSMGRNLPKPVVRKSLATGADNLILLEDEIFDGLDSYATACILAGAINKIGEYDLVLCGREAADTDAGQVGLGIAEILGIPSVSLASRIVLEGQKLKIERVIADGFETVEAQLPALVTVSSEIGALRAAGVKDILAAQKKPVTIWTSKEVAAERLSPRVVLDRLFQPVRSANCQIISGDTPEDAAAKLAQKLKDAKALQT